MLGVVLVLLAGIAVDQVRVQHLAREAARAAVLEIDLPPQGDATISIRRGGNGLVRADVRLRRRLPAAFGHHVELTAQATMVDEP